MSWQEEFKKAFAVDKPGEAEPSKHLAEIVEKVAKAVARRRMTTPALMALEMGRPLNFVAAQAIHFFRPIISVVLDTRDIKEFATFLEQRGSVEYLCRRLEHWSQIGPDAEDTEGASDAQSAPADEGDGPSK
jgi:acyl-CoA reductase-like NAD-dependent aldehyde dehydrogenase